MSSRMSDSYNNLKYKLESLGYCNTLPLEAVPLVESLLSDLLQTTRSLQHYMKVSKDALEQRDALILEAEPYKCDNARLIQEINSISKELMALKEKNIKIIQDSKRKIKTLTNDILKKDALITKLHHELRELSLRGLCAETQSFRNKMKRKDGVDTPKHCFCAHSSSSDISEMQNNIQNLEEKIHEYSDEIALLKSQVSHRDNEIVRLNILLDGGRPISKNMCHVTDSKYQNLLKKFHDEEANNESLRKEIQAGLKKQHEAMAHAVQLADKNKYLQEELKKVDSLALKVEEDCNKKLAELMNEITFQQNRIDTLTTRNNLLETELNSKNIADQAPQLAELEESLKYAKRENEMLNKEISDLIELNKGLQDKIISLNKNNEVTLDKNYYEKHISELQEKLSNAVKKLNDSITRCNRSKCYHASNGTEYVKDLHAKLCESERKILLLKKENDDLRRDIATRNNDSKENWKDIVKQLNIENSELSRENIALSQKLCQYKNINFEQKTEVKDSPNETRLKKEVENLKSELDVVNKDREEYKIRYKDAMSLIDKLRSDLAFKQKQVEQLQEENGSYKSTQRSGKASTERLREECEFLKEQIKKMQSEVIREKSMANQIKNIQIETERSSHDMQNEVLNLQRQNSMLKETISSLDRKCCDLQMELDTLKSSKSKLLENLKEIDQERDKHVIELDNKAEIISVLEHKLKTQSLDVEKLDQEVCDLRRKVSNYQFMEHKTRDYETQIQFLNGEINRLTMQYDNALIENKHLQNNLADTNAALKVSQIEYSKSKKEIDELKQQLQHYVAEIQRIEDLLSHKEAERADMLEHFASLSVEANILENNNHSLESESASKSLQMQNYILKVQELESKLLEKNVEIETLSSRNAELTCKLSSQQSEVKLLTDEKRILEQNIYDLKEMVKNKKADESNVKGADSELKLYENRIKSLTMAKTKLEGERIGLKESLATTERLLSESRKEIIDLKLALQDATLETKSLQQQINRLNRIETEIHETTLTRELELPLMLEETIHEVSHEEDEDSSRYREVTKTYSKYQHGSTL